eukprot:1030180-Prymnesium_polylepis.1
MECEPASRVLAVRTVARLAAAHVVLLAARLERQVKLAPELQEAVHAAGRSSAARCVQGGRWSVPIRMRMCTGAARVGGGGHAHVHKRSTRGLGEVREQQGTVM